MRTTLTTERDFDGLIEVDGEPMGYWLPDGVTAASIGLEDGQ